MAPAVLVVDASPVSARRVREALEGAGYTLVVAEDAGAAAVVIERENVVIALVAVNVTGGNPYALAREVRSRHPESVVFLLAGPDEAYNEAEAHAAGVEGRVERPFAVETIRRHFEAVLGPLGEAAAPIPISPMEEVESVPMDAVAPIPVDAVPIEAMELVDDPPSLAPEALQALPASEAPAPAPPVGDERYATFLPRDFRTYPLVAVDPAVVGPAVERAILEVLPVVVEAVLDKAFHNSRAFRDLVEAAVDEAVRAQVDAIARRVIRERLQEIEAAGDDTG